MKYFVLLIGAYSGVSYFLIRRGQWIKKGFDGTCSPGFLVDGGPYKCDLNTYINDQFEDLVTLGLIPLYLLTVVVLRHYYLTRTAFGIRSSSPPETLTPLERWSNLLFTPVILLLTYLIMKILGFGINYVVKSDWWF